MTARRLAGMIAIAMACGLGVVIVDWLVGWRPRSGIDAHFQSVIKAAQVSDRYDRTGAGWERADVSDQICDRVDLASLQNLGMSKKPFWPLPVNGVESRPIYRWEVAQDKGLIAACADRSSRILAIEIDAETLVCAASVQPRPNCDL